MHFAIDISGKPAGVGSDEPGTLRVLDYPRAVGDDRYHRGVGGFQARPTGMELLDDCDKALFPGKQVEYVERTLQVGHFA
jgi:hypothetical protein